MMPATRKELREIRDAIKRDDQVDVALLGDRLIEVIEALVRRPDEKLVDVVEAKVQPSPLVDGVRRLALQRLTFINANRERLIEAWLAETGLMPSASMLVEQDHGDGRITVHVERRM